MARDGHDGHALPASDQFAAAYSRLQDAARLIDVHPEVLEVLHAPKETVAASLPVRHDDGTLSVYRAWRCRYSDVLGPTKGGIRFHRDSDLAEVTTLALWMTCKCALAGLPFGGAKGAVRVDTHRLSPTELERVARAYVRAFAATIGPERDIPAPDMYTDARVMAWMADEYAQLRGYPEPAVITGKPIALGGSEGRSDATGTGAFLVLQALAQRLGIDGERRAIVVGYGNAGRRVAQLLDGAGWRIVGVADSSGGVYREAGLDLDAVDEAKRSEGKVGATAGGERVSTDALLERPCEVLVPAAVADMITSENAPRVQARVILEVANGPVAAEADGLLHERGVHVVPDILANAGGVVVSYFEWLQNRSRDRWSAAQVHERLQDTLEDAARRVAATADRHGCPLRRAAYAVALQRLAEAIMARSLQVH